MINLVSTIPDFGDLTTDPNIHIHVYGKSPAPGRKLGHITAVAPSRKKLNASIDRILAVIGDRAAGSSTQHEV